jgi:branched-chain amino acid transport system ATP-binding protein
MDDILGINNLTVSYRDFVALRDVSLSVQQGEIAALLGANGAGKSTLLNCIAGLIPSRSGSITLEGAMKNIAAHRRPALGLSLVPEGRRLFAPLTVRQNLRLGLHAAERKGGARQFQTRLDEVLAIFPALEPQLEKAAGDLSGGQQQMVALGRSLMSRPSVLLLDEPSLGLAPQVVEDVFATLARLRSEWRLSILLAEQNAEGALEIADRGFVLRLGSVVIEDSAEALLSRPDVAAAYLAHSIEESTNAKTRNEE